MLYLIGLGLWDEKDISLKALEVAKKCACYAEIYTSTWKGSLEGLGKLVGKHVWQLNRPDLEENLQTLLNTAKESDVAVFVPGDPLSATTHIDLLIEARKQKIDVKIIHNASIFSAIAETGLQLYKFGRTATVPYTKQIGAVRDALLANKELGLHTLLLLDIDPIAGQMPANEAVKLLMETGLIEKYDRLVAVAQLGSESPQITYATAVDLSKKNIGSPSVLVFPGKLHFREKEALERN